MVIPQDMSAPVLPAAQLVAASDSKWVPPASCLLPSTKDIIWAALWDGSSVRWAEGWKRSEHLGAHRFC